jgi:hypothetical protein
MRPATLLLSAAILVAAYPALAQDTSAPPPGEEKSTKTGVLETGAAILQSNAPLGGMDIYLNGFHAARDDATHQMEAHHFCRQVNEDFAQCTLFDGNTKDANLIGIEYIISEKVFDTLPEDERRFWHPHNGEILSGQLVAPGLPAVAEKELMRSKMNSYGKTWHVWNTPSPVSGHGDVLPLGNAMLMWSFSREGELDEKFLKDRDARFKINTAEIGKSRQDLTTLAKPQENVDAMKDMFQGPDLKPIPGVVDKKAAAPAQ